MASFREQMQQLADSISRSRIERKAFVAKNRQSREKTAIESSHQRDRTKRELAMQSRTLAKSLHDFNRNNQKAVARALKDTRRGRLTQAKSMKHSLREEVSKNSRLVARLLRQSNSDRKRNQRLRVRECTLTMHRVKTQVQRIRTATRRMTRSLANDRQEARQVWNRLLHGPSAYRTTDRPIGSPTDIAMGSSRRLPAALAASASLCLSGLTPPPAPY